MKKRSLVVPLFVLSVATIVISGCKKKEMDLSSVHTQGVVKTTAETKSNTAIKVIEETTQETTTQAPTTVATSTTNNLNTKTQNYQNSNASITYPTITDSKDTAKQEQINKLIEKNVSSVVTAMNLDPATTKLNVTSKILDFDGKRLSIAYQGTIQTPDGNTKKIFFTNNIDTTTGKDIGLSDFADPVTLAGYILSDDVRLAGASDEITKKFLVSRFDRSLEDYINILTGADFPLDTDAEGKFTGFPQSFSYEDNGNIYFTIPVSSELGDYITIVYSPDTK